MLIIRNTLLTLSASLGIAGVACMGACLHDAFHGGQRLSHEQVGYLAIAGLLLPHAAVIPLKAARDLPIYRVR